MSKSVPSMNDIVSFGMGLGAAGVLSCSVSLPQPFGYAAAGLTILGTSLIASKIGDKLCSVFEQSASGQPKVAMAPKTAAPEPKGP